ncbi:MAG: class I SAM-dependent methyltransferase [Flavobacteriales bacterium]|jgi:SAM-dependent methyltransferase|nr:class I SAM-dependent methyltransferase [Flavobacteriales bacterium]
MHPSEAIEAQYERRKNDPRLSGLYAPSAYQRHLTAERQTLYARIIRHLGDPAEMRLLEIGAGTGGNIPFFLELGFRPEQLHANELLPDRLGELRENHPNITVHPGDAIAITQELNASFDVVFQSTVFTSILDTDLKRRVAQRMWELTRPGGIVLWYDFTFDNPRNPDVKGVKPREVMDLFPEACDTRFSRVTLAPPIGRRVQRLYPLFNLFPFLRTHVIAILHKPASGTPKQ